MAEIPVAYLAGVLDANGLFAVVDIGETELPRVMLHGLSPEVLEVFSESTGTKIITTYRTFRRHACTAHCPPDHHIQQVKSISARWSVTGGKATVLIHNVLPHLVAKAGVAKDVLNVGLEAPRKKGTFAKMEALGWDLPDG